jgi:hypothetical protein
MTGQRKRVACAGAILMLLSALPATPQAGSAAPRGTYLKTCSKIQFDGTTLAASCSLPEVITSNQIRSTINVTMCGGDIWNRYGHLYCYARSGTWGGGRAIPRGSYFDSCEYTEVGGTVLRASCKNRNGDLTQTSLELKGCRLGSNISNIDGQLVCIN